MDTTIDPLNCNGCGTTCDTAAFEICARGPTHAVCENVDWALWKMPNSAPDVMNGAPNPMGYVDNVYNGVISTVTDLETGLIWQKTVDPGTYTWEEAIAYCSITLSGQMLGGYHDWRLPSYVELVSLVDHGIASPGPAINAKFFPGTPADVFWSSTRVAALPPAAVYVDFDAGYSVNAAVTYAHFVRCVR